jgi:hypothetical protein
MRAFTILLIAMALASVPHRAYAGPVNTSLWCVPARAINVRLCRVTFRTSPLAQSGVPRTRAKNMRRLRSKSFPSARVGRPQRLKERNTEKNDGAIALGTTRGSASHF